MLSGGFADSLRSMGVFFLFRVHFCHFQRHSPAKLSWLPIDLSVARYIFFITDVKWCNKNKTLLAATLCGSRPPQTPKNTFLGSPSPQGSHCPYILGDTTRPGHATYLLVWSKSDQRRLTKTLHKQTNRQTNKQTDRHYENNGHLAVNQKNVKTWQFKKFVNVV